MYEIKDSYNTTVRIQNTLSLNLEIVLESDFSDTAYNLAYVIAVM